MLRKNCLRSWAAHALGFDGRSGKGRQPRQQAPKEYRDVIFAVRDQLYTMLLFQTHFRLCVVLDILPFRKVTLPMDWAWIETPCQLLNVLLEQSSFWR